MIYFKTILAIVFVAIFTAAMVVLPFVLLHEGLGASVFYSLLGSWAWTSLVLCIILLTDVKDPKDQKNPEDAQ